MRKEFTQIAEKIMDRKVEGQSEKSRQIYFLVKCKGLPDLEAIGGKLGKRYNTITVREANQGLS